MQTAWNAALAFIGGPVGAAILVTAGAVTYFATRQSAAEKAARDHADALRQVGSSADALELKLTKVGGALTNVEKLQAQAKLRQAEENMAATRGSLGTANSSTGLLGRWVSDRQGGRRMRLRRSVRNLPAPRLTLMHMRKSWRKSPSGTRTS